MPLDNSAPLATLYSSSLPIFSSVIPRNSGVTSDKLSPKLIVYSLLFSSFLKIATFGFLVVMLSNLILALSLLLFSGVCIATPLIRPSLKDLTAFRL